MKLRSPSSAATIPSGDFHPITQFRKMQAPFAAATDSFIPEGFMLKGATCEAHACACSHGLGRRKPQYGGFYLVADTL